MYLDYARLHKAERTVKEDERRLDHFLAFVKKRNLGDITPRNIEEFQAGRGRKVSRQTLKRDMDLIRAAFRWALRQELIAENPCSKVDPIQIKTRATPRFLDAREKARLLDVAHGTRYYPVIVTALYTGARLSELIHMEWKDLDFDRKTIRICPKADFTPKDEEERPIPIHSKLAEVLRPLANGSGLVFHTSNGTPYLRRNLLRVLYGLRDKASIPDLTWNILRHTYASELVQKGVSIFMVSRLLGHSTSRITERHYAALAPQDLHEEVGRLS